MDNSKSNSYPQNPVRLWKITNNFLGFFVWFDFFKKVRKGKRKHYLYSTATKQTTRRSKTPTTTPKGGRRGPGIVMSMGLALGEARGLTMTLEGDKGAL